MSSAASRACFVLIVGEVRERVTVGPPLKLMLLAVKLMLLAVKLLLLVSPLTRLLLCSRLVLWRMGVEKVLGIVGGNEERADDERAEEERVEDERVAAEVGRGGREEVNGAGFGAGGLDEVEEEREIVTEEVVVVVVVTGGISV
jgi:hypothetical protein